jgi:NAD-dependent SIR2 family protein deacetylase
MPDHMKHMVPGKASVCHGCDNQFVLDSENMKEERPRCNDCRGILSETEIPLSDAMRDFIEGKSSS